jgi:hypothetical protein
MSMAGRDNVDAHKRKMPLPTKNNTKPNTIKKRVAL